MANGGSLRQEPSWLARWEMDAMVGALHAMVADLALELTGG